MASMDRGLILALRRLYWGDIVYGTYSDVLKNYCERKGINPAEADLMQPVSRLVMCWPYDRYGDRAFTILCTFSQAALT